jgi:hypothetical protein
LSRSHLDGEGVLELGSLVDGRLRDVVLEHLAQQLCRNNSGPEEHLGLHARLARRSGVNLIHTARFHRGFQTNNQKNLDRKTYFQKVSDLSVINLLQKHVILFSEVVTL